MANLINWMDYIRPHILNLKPYASARDEFSGDAKVFLDANENPFDEEHNGWNRYPDPHQKAIKAKISQLKSVDAGEIFLGNGSDEAIDLLFRIFCEPGKDAVITCPPTYGMYSVSASIHNVRNVEVPLTEDFQLDVEEILKASKNGVKMLFICSPNNPTGNSLRQDAIEKLLKEFQGIVIIDEAYIDFSPQQSWSKMINKYPHLVVLQTLSKAWGLASVRLGMAFANEQLIKILNKVKPPYNISGPNQQVVLKALEGEEKMENQVAEIISEREILEQLLTDVPGVKRIYSSDANFLLVQMNDAADKYQAMIEKGVVVRDRSRVMLCEDCLRITVGTKEENKQLVALLEEISH
ncbi:histidinol-phosphate transaminase [Marivirga sp. S37H4]|uniref:Histidinol-phosphate aminotransferase n=1 Tax=Marivirga aurantiaca TaxID=2802615 RepID=A0A934WVL5_9BACT|nr:histidinol-phosphate transaminase [Marivirga aurantiaca]MBK6263868.1 histidinol-phosphate transaminase [Marivirga aurantiaca]